MKQAKSTNKTVRRGVSASRQDSGSGSQGISISPPHYGIDFVDQDIAENNDSEARTPPQRKFDSGFESAIQFQSTEDTAENRTGMPDQLKAGLEQLSGMDLSAVRVHYNSAKPAQLGALAYTKGQDIHVGPGQEHYLPHEGWHVVQQMEGRVRPTMQTMGVPINDEANLEREADIIGAKANQLHNSQSSVIGSPISAATAAKNFNGISQPKIQRFLKTPKTNKPPIVVIQRVATVDLVDAGNDRGYLIGVGWPDVNAHLTAYGMYLTNMLAAFAANTGAANPPAGSPLDLAAAGIRRFTQRIIESLDGFDGELREVDRLSNKGRAAVPAGGGPIPGAIPILGYPAIGPDIMYLKPGGYTGMEVKSPNTDAVGAVNTDILDADGQLGGFLLNRQKIMINIMHQDNPWPGMVGGHGTFFTRLNDLALEGAIDAQLNGMAILNADMITILNVNTNYAPNQEDVVATWNGAAWVSNVL